MTDMHTMCPLKKNEELWVSLTLGAKHFSSAVSGFCQVFFLAASANTENSHRTRGKPLVPGVGFTTLFATRPEDLLCKYEFLLRSFAVKIILLSICIFFVLPFLAIWVITFTSKTLRFLYLSFHGTQSAKADLTKPADNKGYNYLDQRLHL